MTVDLDWILWLLAAISFGFAAVGVKPGRLDLMLLGFMFIAITFLVQLWLQLKCWDDQVGADNVHVVIAPVLNVILNVKRKTYGSVSNYDKWCSLEREVF